VVLTLDATPVDGLADPAVRADATAFLPALVDAVAGDE
jgi:hypothetical protein